MANEIDLIRLDLNDREAILVMQSINLVNMVLLGRTDQALIIVESFRKYGYDYGYDPNKALININAKLARLCVAGFSNAKEAKKRIDERKNGLQQT